MKRNILLIYVGYDLTLFFSNKIRESHLSIYLCIYMVLFVCIILIYIYHVYISKYTFNKLPVISYFTKY